MLILTLRTDKPEAEIGLYDGAQQLDYQTWQAHRQLAETLHLKVAKLLEVHAYKLHDLGGLAVYQGPGSFTGLRIGITVANALADSLTIPIIGATGDEWLVNCLQQLAAGQSSTTVIPEYGALPNITQPRK